MHISVLKAPVMLCVLVHGDLWASEHRRLIHVIPCVQVQGRTRVFVQIKLLCPELADFWIQEIWPAR